MRAQYPDAVVTYTYDSMGRTTRIDDSQGGSVEWSYDGQGRIISERTPSGLVSYTYNADGQRSSMTVEGRTPVNYGYDNLERLQTITQGADSFTYEYDLVSRISSLTRPNGVKTIYQYDPAGRLARMAHNDAGNLAIEDQQYHYDADGNVVSIISLAANPVLPEAKVNTTADANNRITQAGAFSYAFNDEGQTTTRTNPQGSTQYEWDSRGRMTRATLATGQVVSYSYDALGRRASRTENGVATNFVYDGQDVVLDKVNNVAAVDFLSGQGLDDKLSQTSSSAGPLYFLSDHLRTTMALTNAAGAVVEREQYEPFGQTAGSGFTRYGYTGRERDQATGLLYFRARWFDPDQGRFVSEDPAGTAGGTNLYQYARNNPLRFHDPQGLWPTRFGYTTHQNSPGRVLKGTLSGEELALLQSSLYHADDSEWQTVPNSYRHAMTAGDDTVSHARWMANGFTRGQLSAAKKLFDKCKRKEAMFYLGLGMHAMQDATSPAHQGFQKYYGGAWELGAHIYSELFDPMQGSRLDNATMLAYRYAKGDLPMPDDFFNGLGYDQFDYAGQTWISG